MDFNWVVSERPNLFENGWNEFELFLRNKFNKKKPLKKIERHNLFYKRLAIKKLPTDCIVKNDGRGQFYQSFINATRIG